MSVLPLRRNDTLPSPALERWKYTNLPSFVRGFPQAAVEAKMSVSGDLDFVTPLEDANVSHILCVRAPEEVRFKDMTLWHMAQEAPVSGYMVDIPAGRSVDKPVNIGISSISGKTACPRLIIRVGDGAEVTVLETHDGNGGWNNGLTQIILGHNAKLHHYRMQDYGTKAVYTQSTHVMIGRDSTYDAFTMTTGAALSRNQIHAEIKGKNADCLLRGINLLRGEQLGDTTITIEHQAPHCHSNQFYRTVLDDRARGVFQGKVHVHQIAQKTDGYQLSNALILSEGAEMDTKPELEIYADDVKCSHGATTGQLNEEALFYMKARGISEEDARALLIQAFVGEVADKLVDKSMDNRIAGRIQEWLGL